MAEALDEVSTEYGLLAESVRHPADFSSVTYRLRADARWHDGKPVTVDDVIFSLDVLQEASSAICRVLPARHQGRENRRTRRDVHLRRARQSRAAADRRPALRAAQALVGRHRRQRQQARHRPDADWRRRSASGPYRVKSFIAGRTVVYERVKDYWGKDLNVNVGRDNFDEIRFEYFRDITVALEAFKGDAIDWRTENSALNWATRYDFPARTEKRVILEEFPIRSQGGDAGVRVQHAAREIQRSAGAPRVQFCVRFRRDEQAALLRSIHADRELFRGHRARIARIARRRGARDPRDRARQGSAGSLHDALHQSDWRQSRAGPGQPARRRAAPEGRRLGSPRSPACVGEDQGADDDRVPERQPDPGTYHPVLQAGAGAAWRHGDRAHRR